MTAWFSTWLIIGFVLFLLGFGLLYRCFRLRKLKKHFIAASYLSFALISLLIGALLILIGFAQQNFQKLNHEELIGEIAIERLESQTFLVRLFIPGKEAQHFELRGDQWQVDARVLKWHAWVNIFGLHTLYKLERLSSRYHNPKQGDAISVISLSNNENTKANRQAPYAFLQWLPVVDTIYGNSAYMPLGHGARYRLSIGTSGIVARPMNDRALKLVQMWP